MHAPTGGNDQASRQTLLGHPATAADAVALLQNLTSFMALKDPELLAAAPAALGADALAPIFSAAPAQAVGAYLDGPGGPPTA